MNIPRPASTALTTAPSNVVYLAENPFLGMLRVRSDAIREKRANGEQVPDRMLEDSRIDTFLGFYYVGRHVLGAGNGWLLNADQQEALEFHKKYNPLMKEVLARSASNKTCLREELRKNIDRVNEALRWNHERIGR